MSKFSKGFLVGSLIAGAYTLLNAKQPGKETQQQLRLKATDTINDIKAFKNATTNTISSTKSIQEGITQLNQTIADIKESVTAFQIDNQHTINRIQRKLEKVTSHFNKEDN